jgi:hypothetical protein
VFQFRISGLDTPLFSAITIHYGKDISALAPVRQNRIAAREAAAGGTMRRMLMTVIALGLMLSCSRKQVNTDGTGYGFETKRIYTIAVFPLSFSGSVSLNDLQRESLYSYLVSNLIVTGRFDMVDRALVGAAVNPEASLILPVLTRDKARSLGELLHADVVCLTEVNVKQAAPPIVLAKVDIFPVVGSSPSYTGSGQAKDSASLLTAAELALDSATAKIVK